MMWKVRHDVLKKAISYERFATETAFVERAREDVNCCVEMGRAVQMLRHK